MISISISPQSRKISKSEGPGLRAQGPEDWVERRLLHPPFPVEQDGNG